jgi:hypothetical protein
VNARPRRKASTAIALLVALLLLIPVVIVHLIPTDTVEPYVFQGRLSEYLAQSANGQLRYYAVDVVEGSAPASRIVVALDRSYSRGYRANDIMLGLIAWYQGSLMTPDVFYGEQYLFFGLPQVYVRQVKSGILWPDQWTELRILYLSPLTTLAAPLQILFLARSDVFSYTILGVLVARCLLIASVATLVFRRRVRGIRLVTLLLGYAIVAVLVTVPMLGHLY